MQAQTKKPFVAPTLKNEASLTEITLSGIPDGCFYDNSTTSSAGPESAWLPIRVACPQRMTDRRRRA